MTREIESTFEYQKNTYKVVKDTLDDICNKCAFRNTNCDNKRRIIGECMHFYRTDRKDVHFELITNNKE